ncbi:MAG: hypothetical protein J7K81_08475 [Methanophagales archaeon]|nr:hypothetical protein [Methanophagales archaeon]
MRKNTIKKEDILKIYTDGAARGNPGPGACAFIFVKGCLKDGENEPHKG